MKITQISVFQVDLPLKEGSYHWSGGKSVSVFDSTIVQIDTDEGITGWGEVCPLGPFYLPAFGQGARAGIYELGPHRRVPSRINETESSHGRSVERSHLRQISNRHGLLGYSRKGYEDACL